MKQWEKYIRHHLDYVDKTGFSADFSLVVQERKECYLVEWSENGTHRQKSFKKYADARDFYGKLIGE